MRWVRVPNPEFQIVIIIVPNYYKFCIIQPVLGPPNHVYFNRTSKQGETAKLPRCGKDPSMGGHVFLIGKPHWLLYKLCRMNKIYHLFI